jgi:hypothetical protein
MTKMTPLLLATAIISSVISFSSASEYTSLLRGADSGGASGTRLSDPKTVSKKPLEENTGISTADRQPSRRKFVSYTSSYFERLWLTYVDKWANEKLICDNLMDQQSSLLHDLLDLTCTRRYMPPHQWCIIDDNIHPLWYHWGNRDEFV